MLGSEFRAFNSLGGGPALTGYGPNINIARDPRFVSQPLRLYRPMQSLAIGLNGFDRSAQGRNSELPGECPYLSGSCTMGTLSRFDRACRAANPESIALLQTPLRWSRVCRRETRTATPRWRLS